MAGGTLENYGKNVPIATVTAGGTTNSDTSWTVTVASPFPSAGAGPPALQFHVADISNPSETIAVTNVSGSTWTVVRGSEGTTAFSHNANFVVAQVATGQNGMASFYQLAGLTSTTATSVTNTTTATPIASIYVPSNGTYPGGVGPGVTYELQAWGSFETSSATASGTATVSVFWDTATGTALASFIASINGTQFVNSSGTAVPMYINCLVTFPTSTQAVAMLQLLWRNSTVITTGPSTFLAVPTAPVTINGTSGAAQQLCITWGWKTALSTNTAGFYGMANQVQ